MNRYDGMSALVTGAGSGIGRAMALRLADEGCAVLCADIDQDGTESTAAKVLEHGGKSAAVVLDVTDSDAVKDALERTISEFGSIDVLMNNAGVGGGAGWDQTIAVNLSGVYYGLLHGCKMMAERGGGSIVNTASVAGLNGLVGGSGAVKPADINPSDGPGAYTAAKHGVVGLTRQFAVIYGKQNVRVNALCPGYIFTPMTAGMRDREGGQEFLESLHPMGRLGEPEEIASAAAFLASSDASFVTGVALPIDGGYTAR
jgi:NAD(P)-dependent dehydrogenase (short-subunit alcohol dehydrogenase family)